MPPGEEHEEEFVENIAVGYVEVMFERGDGDVSIQLGAG